MRVGWVSGCWNHETALEMLLCIWEKFNYHLDVCLKATGELIGTYRTYCILLFFRRLGHSRFSSTGIYFSDLLHNYCIFLAHYCKAIPLQPLLLLQLLFLVHWINWLFVSYVLHVVPSLAGLNAFQKLHFCFPNLWTLSCYCGLTPVKKDWFIFSLVGWNL